MQRIIKERNNRKKKNNRKKNAVDVRACGSSRPGPGGHAEHVFFWGVDLL